MGNSTSIATSLLLLGALVLPNSSLAQGVAPTTNIKEGYTAELPYFVNSGPVKAVKGQAFFVATLEGKNEMVYKFVGKNRVKKIDLTTAVNRIGPVSFPGTRHGDLAVLSLNNGKNNIVTTYRYMDYLFLTIIDPATGKRLAGILAMPVMSLLLQ